MVRVVRSGLMSANEVRAETLPALEIPSAMFREWLSTAGLPDLAERDAQTGQMDGFLVVVTAWG